MHHQLVNALYLTQPQYWVELAILGQHSRLAKVVVEHLEFDYAPQSGKRARKNPIHKAVPQATMGGLDAFAQTADERAFVARLTWINHDQAVLGFQIRPYSASNRARKSLSR